MLYFIDQFEDQFEKRSKEKGERIAKNEYQRLRNLARNKKGKVKGSHLGLDFDYTSSHVCIPLVPIPPPDQSWNKEQVCT